MAIFMQQESEQKLPPREWISVREAMGILNCNNRAIYRLVNNGQLRSMPDPFDSKATLISIEDIIKLAPMRPAKPTE